MESKKSKIPVLSKETDDLKDYQRKLIASITSSNEFLVDAIKSVFMGTQPTYIDDSNDGELKPSKLEKRKEKRDAFANARFQLTYILSENAIAKSFKRELQNRTDFNEAIDTNNPEKLWSIIKDHHSKTDTPENKALALVEAKIAFSAMKQGADEDIKLFNTRFKGSIDKIAKLGGNFAAHDAIDATDETKDIQLIAEYLHRCSKTIQNVVLPAFHGRTLAKSLNTVMDHCATIGTVSDTPSVTANYAKKNDFKRKKGTNKGDSDTKQKKRTEHQPDKKKRKLQDSTNTESDEESVRVEVSAKVATTRAMSVKSDQSTQVQLDSGCDRHIVANAQLLMRVKALESPVIIHGIAGTAIQCTSTGILDGVGWVLHCKEVGVNLLSLAQLIKKDAVSYDEGNFTLKSNQLMFKATENYTVEWPQSHQAHQSSTSKSKTLEQAEAIRRLHVTLGHPSDTVLLATAKNRCIDGITVDQSAIKQCNELLGKCIPCLTGKLTRTRENFTSAPEVDRPGAYITCDIMYIDKDTPVLVIVDHYSKYISAQLLFDKSGKNIASALNNFFNLLTSHGHTPADGELRSDREANFNAGVIQSLLAEKHMYFSQSSPEQHAPSAERAIRLIKERYRTIKSSLPYRLPKVFNKELIDHICDTINLVAHTGNTESPYQMLTGSKCDISTFPSPVFGDIVSVFTGNDDTESARSKPAICLGRDQRNHKAILYGYVNDTQRRVSSSTIYKAIGSFQLAISTLGSNNDASSHSSEGGSTVAPAIEVSTDGGNAPQPISLAQRLKEALAKKQQQTVRAHNITVRSALEKHKEMAAAAITEELKCMLQYEVFKPVKGRVKAIPSHMFIKEKYIGDNLDRLRARLVAGGHKQDMPVGYTYAPTIDPAIAELVLVNAVSKKYDFELWDIKSAYLNASNGDSIINMKLSAEITEQLIKLKPDWSKYVHHGTLTVQLLKALYGTKEAARLWYNEISSELLKFGFDRSTTDPALFHLRRNGTDQITVCTHVDDLVVISNNNQLKTELQSAIERKFRHLTVQKGQHMRYLGIDITHTENCMKMSQKDQIDKLEQKIKSANLEQINEKSHKDYRSLVMSLMYIACRTRPDVMYNTSMLASKCSDPQIEDFKRLESLLKYVIKTKHYCKVFKQPTTNVLHIFSDAAWNSHPDGKGHTGYAIFLGNATGAIACKSVKQKIVTPAAAHAELEALSKATEKAETIFSTMKFLGLNPKVIFHQDNESVIKTLKMDVLKLKKMKRMLPKILTIKESMKNMKAVVKHVVTEKQISDLLTKPISGSKRDTLTTEILGCSLAKMSEGVLEP